MGNIHQNSALTNIVVNGGIAKKNYGTYPISLPLNSKMQKNNTKPLIKTDSQQETRAKSASPTAPTLLQTAKYNIAQYKRMEISSMQLQKPNIIGRKFYVVRTLTEEQSNLPTKPTSELKVCISI